MSESDEYSLISMPLIPLLISYLGGLVFSWHIHISPHTFQFFLIIFFPTLLWSVLKKWKRISTPLSLIILFLIGSLFMHVSLYPHLPSDHISRFVTDKKMDIEGRIYLSPEASFNKTRIYFKAEKIHIDKGFIPVSGRVLITVRELHKRFSYGDRVRLSSRLRRPRNFGNPGGFDYERYLEMRKILVTGFVMNSKGIIKISQQEGNLFFSLIEKTKDKIRTLIERKAGISTKGILKALILGERGEISQDVREDFIIAGVAHILAISGLHLGIIAFIFFFFVRILFLQSERLTLLFNINKIAAFSTIFPVIFYAVIAGMKISTMRAAIMIIAYLISIIIERESELYNTLALAASIILIIFPASLFDASFQLSFISVLSIVYLTARFGDLVKKDDLPYQPSSFVKNFFLKDRKSVV